MPRKIALFALLFLAGCARPNIELDTRELEAAVGRVPVGMVEVHRANSGKTPGIPIGETLSESAYCTAALLADGRVIAATSCLQNKDGAFAAEDMTFHLNTGRTEHYSVISRQDEPEAGFTYLQPVGTGEIGVAGALSRQSAPLAANELQDLLDTFTIGVLPPDENGIARIKAWPSQVVLALSASSQPSTENEVVLSPEEMREQDYSKPRDIALRGAAESEPGSLVFRQNKIVAIVNAPRAAKGGRWIVGVP